MCCTRPAIKIKFRAKWTNCPPLSHHTKQRTWSELVRAADNTSKSMSLLFPRVHLFLSGSERGGGRRFPLEAECAVADMMCNRCEAAREETITAACADPGHTLPICPLMSHQAESLAPVSVCVCVCMYSTSSISSSSVKGHHLSITPPTAPLLHPALTHHR